jgi:hypothetical protein
MVGVTPARLTVVTGRRECYELSEGPDTTNRAGLG